jgi:hypothetical protein
MHAMKTMPLPNAFAETLRETLDEWLEDECLRVLGDALPNLFCCCGGVESTRMAYSI